MADTSVAIGTVVPPFEGQAIDGVVRLADLAGKTVVLYFYPKDNTPGCTIETQEFGDAHADFTAANAVVYGVSRDSIKSHVRFRTALGLPFDLISDPDEALCALFGVMKQKNMYGKQVRGVERSTFVLDGHGSLVREWRGVKVPGHVGEVLAQVRSM